MENPATVNQPKPKGIGVDIGELVKGDIEARIAKGEITYGERLKSFNGRNALWDAYQEALDLAIYLRQAIAEKPEGDFSATLTNPLTTPNPACGCQACNPAAWWMVVCDTCGNKRCPHATNHDHACTNSNEPGQPGSVFN